MDMDIFRLTAESIEREIDLLQKEQVEIEDKANNVMSVYITHLGLYSLLCNTAMLLLQVHISCNYSVWICSVFGMVFLGGLVAEFLISLLKIKNIKRVSETLLRKLRPTRQEAEKLLRSISDHEAAEAARAAAALAEAARAAAALAEAAGVVAPGASSSLPLRMPRDSTNEIEQLKKRARMPVELEKSLSRFYWASIVQLTIPAVALFIVFTAIIIGGYLSCDKTPRHVAYNILHMRTVLGEAKEI